MEQNNVGVKIGIKMIPKKEMYITTSDGGKYKIKDVRDTLTLTTDKMYNSVFKFNVTREIKPSTVNESDRTFLDYIPDDYKYMARDEDGSLFVYKERPQKRSEVWIYDSELFGIYKAKVRCPMVKWENKEPWLIEDIKKLEVVDEF